MVRVDWSLGVPYIDGVMPDENARPTEDVPAPDDPTGIDAVDTALDLDFGAYGRSPDAPASLLPGDFLRSSPDHAAVGALHGRVALLHGGHLAQIIANGNHDQVEIIAGQLRQLTWMGESRTINDGGRTSFIWEGGSSQLSETGVDEEHYTIHLRVGAEGNQVKFSITTPDQLPLFEGNVSREGRLDLFASAGGVLTLLDRLGLGHALRISGPLTTTVEGTVEEHLGRDRTVSITGTDTREVDHDVITRAGNDHVVQTIRHDIASIGGDSSTQVEGETRATLKGDVTGTCQGKLSVTASGETKLRSSGPLEIRGDGVVTLKGGDDLSIDIGSHTLKITADHLEAGGTANAAALFNETKQILQATLQLLALHTHPLSTGTSSPTLLPVTPVTNMLDSMRSRRLKTDG